MMRKLVIGHFALVFLFTVFGCASDEQPSKGMRSSTMQKSLYDRLGGKPAITAVVDQFVANVAADNRINQRFASTDIPRFKGLLVDQVCQATGGPCVYKGRDMKTAHKGMGITNADFTALVGDLTAALNQLKVPQKEQQELISLLAPMKGDIVESP